MRNIEHIRALTRLILKELTVDHDGPGLIVRANNEMVKECGQEFAEIALSMPASPAETKRPEWLKDIDMRSLIREEIMSLVLADQEFGELVLRTAGSYDEMSKHAEYMEYRCEDLKGDIKRLQRKLKTGYPTQTPTGEGG